MTTSSRLLNLPNTPALISDPVIYQEINEIYKALKLIAEELENSDDDTAATLAEILQRLKREEEEVPAGGTDLSGEYLIVSSDGNPILAAWNTQYDEVASFPINTSFSYLTSIAFHTSGIGVIKRYGTSFPYLVTFDGTYLTLHDIAVYGNSGESVEISADGEYMYTESGKVNVYKRYYDSGVQRLQEIQRADVSGAASGLAISHSGNYIALQQTSGGYYLAVYELDSGYIDDSTYFARVAAAYLPNWGIAWNYDDSLIAIVTGSGAQDAKIYQFPAMTEIVFAGQTQIAGGSSYTRQLCWHPTENYLLVGSATSTYLALYSEAAGVVTDLTSSISAQPATSVCSVTWNAAGTIAYVICTGDDVRVYAFDSATETLTYKFTRALAGSGTVGQMLEFVFADLTVAEKLQYVGWTHEGLDANNFLSARDFKCTRNPASGSGSMYCKHAKTKTSGKFAVRFTVTRTSGQYGPFLGIGKSYPPASTLGSNANEWALWSYDSGVAKSVTRNNGVNTPQGAYGDLDPAQEVMMEVDFDSGKIWFGIDGTWFGSGDPGAGTNETYSGLGTGTFYLILDLFQTGGENSVVLVHPDDFVTPASTGFTLGWPEN